MLRSSDDRVSASGAPIWLLDYKRPKYNQCPIGDQFSNNNNEALTRMADKYDDTKNK